MTAIWYTLDGLKIGIARYTFAGKFVKDKTVLEIGCENGYGASYLLSRGAQKVVAGDISQKAIEYAIAHYQRNGLQFLFLDAQKLQFADSSVDVVVAFEVIEHLEKYQDFLGECQRVLKDGGTFICSTPNREIASPNADKPWFPGHVKEFDFNEFHDVLANYFQDVLIYGIGSESRSPGIIEKMIYLPKPKVLQFLRPAGVKIMNIVTRFILRGHHFISLEEIDEKELDKMADKKYQPLPLQGDSLSALSLIAVARK